MRKAPVLPTPGLHFTHHRLGGNESMRESDFIPIAQEQLKELLSYDQETGIFTWRTSYRKCKAGEVAGRDYGTGYLAIWISPRTYQVHRLVWLYVHGQWPENFIDHINGNKLDNRISNLRDVTNSENMMNLRQARTDNKHGVMSVHQVRNKFIAQIQTKGITKRIGSFNTPEEAHAAYISEKRKLHPTCTI